MLITVHFKKGEKFKKNDNFVNMQFTNYINDLLYRYECVIIPGFGAFLTHYKPAQIDLKSDRFHAPSKIISFNSQLQANDGLLANYIASAEKCSYETALQSIRKFNSEITSKLGSGEKVAVKNIGEFFLNEEKSVQFEPLANQNFSTSAFGLTSFVSPKIVRELMEAEKVLADKPTIAFVPEKKITRPYLKYAAIAVIALCTTGFAGMKIYENEVRKFNYAERQEANTLLENEIQEATFVIESPLPIVNLNLPKNIGKYHIVAGAYRMEENADKKIEQLREKGFTPVKMDVSRYGLHQVLYGSYEDRLEALKELRNIKQSENSDAWLLVQELE